MSVGVIKSDLNLIVTRSGQKMTLDQLKEIIKKVIRVAVRRAIMSVLRSYLPHVAMKDNALREQLKQMISNPVKMIDDKIEIVFDMDWMKLLEYAEYHIDRKPSDPTDVSPYVDPWTAGTRPIQSLEFMEELEVELVEQIERGLRSYGI